MSTRKSALHDAITEAITRMWPLTGPATAPRIADDVLRDPRVRPLIEGVGSEERERWARWLERTVPQYLIEEDAPCPPGVLAELRHAAALLRAGPRGEPVAWMVEEDDEARFFSTEQEARKAARENDWAIGIRVVPLYRSAGPTEAPGHEYDCRIGWGGPCTCHLALKANEPGGGASEGAACVDCGEELGGRHLSGCPLAESVADRLVRPRDTDADSKSVSSAAPQDEPRQQDAEEAWAVIEGWVEEDPAKREQFHPGTIYVHRSVANPRAGWTRAILLAAARAPKEEA